MTYAYVSMYVEGKRAVLNVSSVLHLFYYSSTSVVGEQLYMIYYSSTSAGDLQLTTRFETTQVDPELSATPGDLGFAVIIQL